MVRTVDFCCLPRPSWMGQGTQLIVICQAISLLPVVACCYICSTSGSLSVDDRFMAVVVVDGKHGDAFVTAEGKDHGHRRYSTTVRNSSTKTGALAVENRHARVLSGSCGDPYRTTHLLAPANVLDDGGNAITPLHDAYHQRAIPRHTFLKTLAGNTSSPPVMPTAKHHDSSRCSHVVLEGCKAGDVVTRVAKEFGAGAASWRDKAVWPGTSPEINKSDWRARRGCGTATTRVAQFRGWKGKHRRIAAGARVKDNIRGAASREILLLFRSPAKTKTEHLKGRELEYRAVWCREEPRVNISELAQTARGIQRDEKNVEHSAGVCKTDSQWPGQLRCSPSILTSAAWANGTNVQFRLAVGLRDAGEDQERVDRRVDGPSGHANAEVAVVIRAA
ncbi:hypothetical protein C8J57DRAFT_1488412 [Mycena rebaudengoi]|nr:hypothetical protein C8J57DRAFT_1488412 [Mycena rebaudengoi]